MSKVQTVTIAAAEADQRIDRWFKKKYPAIPHGQIEKMLRKGEICVDGRRIAANYRLQGGETVRLPPLPSHAPAPKTTPVSPQAARDLAASILYRDEDMLAINKPSGLAVQGGTGIRHSLDDMLDHLRFGADRPLLVHRLDRDTSGILLLARNVAAARKLAALFRGRDIEKTYWALVRGVPHPLQGRIALNLSKKGAPGQERMRPDEEGKSAVTYYAVLEHAGKKAAFLALRPETGRTHQLRAHCAELGTPIMGDGKYGEAPPGPELPRRLHLHAHTLRLPKLRGAGTVIITAPLPAELRRSWQFFGFSPDYRDDPFALLHA
ncbi:MAG TPA: RluA family pseudouridine synthase [Dongiaceae bacterium]|jgi:23S rRNA pseudouridine955/2504/2580 synthase|nr:RluA family pseudouridine synthase [Dongiaceae bacterium]